MRQARAAAPASALTVPRNAKFLHLPVSASMLGAARPAPSARTVAMQRRSSSDGETTREGGGGSPPVRTSFDVESAPLLPLDVSRVEAASLLPAGEEAVDWTMTALLFLFPAMGGMLFGYDIGATSGALLSMTDPAISGTTWYNLSSFTSGLVVSLSLGGALLGSCVALLYGDQIGRRRELLAASVLYAAGATAVAAAPALPVVMAGRLVYGVGIGLAMHAAPAYIAETSPARVRGLLISLKEAFIVGGILAGYVVSSLLVDSVGGWRSIYATSLPLAAVLAGGMFWLPESPRWLLLSGAGAAPALSALRRLKGTAAVESAIRAEVEEIDAAMVNSPTAGGGGFAEFGAVFQPRYRRPLAIGVSLMLFQQVTGQPSVLYYAAKTFQEAGFTGTGESTRISVVLGLFKLLMTGVAVITVDSVGRRPLLLGGITGIVASLAVLGAVAAGVGGLAPGMAAGTNLVALLVYVGAYQMSFGPISWLMVGEVFPLRVRGQAIALATLTNFASNFGVSLVLPSILDTWGPEGTYFGFAAVGVIALATINAIVPETKGKTLEDIEKLWTPDTAGGSGGGGGGGSGPGHFD